MFLCQNLGKSRVQYQPSMVSWKLGSFFCKLKSLDNCIILLLFVLFVFDESLLYITDFCFFYSRQLREAFNSINTSSDGRLSLSDVRTPLWFTYIWSYRGNLPGVFTDIMTACFYSRFVWLTRAAWDITWISTGWGSVAITRRMPPTALRSFAVSLLSTTP